MKVVLKIVGLLLSIVMISTVFFACKKGDETSANDSNTVNTYESNKTNEFTVAQTNYNADFNILAPNWGTYQEFFFYDTEAGNTGNPIDQALYTRTERVRSHLGVNLKYLLDGEGKEVLKTPHNKFTSMVTSGDDVYQLYLTHTYHGVATLATGGYLYDFKELDDINLDASYWNKTAMEKLTINSSLYYGHGDYLIGDPNAVFFNKTIQENWKLKDFYSMVRNGTWTLENMMLESFKINESGSKATKQLGFACQADWYFMSLLDSCDTQVIVNDGEYAKLNMSSSNERYSNVYDMIESLCRSDTSLVYTPQVHGVADDDKGILSGRVLFSFVPLHQANSYRNTDVKFGILPYPKYDTDQKEYYSFDWSGLMCVPITISNKSMVGQTLECLSYFSANGENDLYTAYYENLLGSKLADSPDDYEMIRVIYDNLVTNPVINMMHAGSDSSISQALTTLAYTYSNLSQSFVEGKGEKIDSVTVMWAQYGTLGQRALDESINS